MPALGGPIDAAASHRLEEDGPVYDLTARSERPASYDRHCIPD